MPPTQMPVDFSSLSDMELSQMLKDYNVTVGPINAATRRTYERKLIKLKTGHDSPPSQRYEPVDDDDDDEDEEVQIRQPVNRTPAVSNSPQARLRKEQQQDTYSASPRIESRPNLGTSRKTTTSYTPALSESSTRYSSESQRDYSSNAKVNASKGVPLWVKIIAVAVVLVLLFLIYSNMEPLPVNNIPSIGEKVEV
ncbi:unnamed protein product [Lymnaea stagnalis]|uniref:LEM domain-containing protein n=1 Tax=Lymnaea stagnalis TaxID=6523 RepID=A0AAV2HD54_LYMST